jgi:hypothetical protein
MATSNVNVTHATPVDLEEFRAATAKQLAEPAPYSLDHKPAFIRPAATFVPQPDDTTDNPYTALNAVPAFASHPQRHTAKDPFTGEAYTVPQRVIDAQFANAAVLALVAESHRV